ncbi:MAG: hypothetical protein OEZ06_05715 [Myxococcales bacterium]|nr:hypothetical protein [Myxococcales bacterium]
MSTPWVTHTMAALAAATLLLLLGGGASVQAQSSGQSQMGQGQAAIQVRSDVKLGIKGTAGTNNERLQQLTEAVGDQMGAVKSCYRDLVKKRPTTVGSFAIKLSLASGAKVGLEVKENGGSDADLRKCVEKVFRRAGYKGVDRPAAAIVSLEFANSRAEGQDEMVEHMRAADRVEVAERPEGGFEARWKEPAGRLEFVVVGKDSMPAVEVALRTLRDNFAAFLDCRRRAEKDGKSPAGQIDVSLRLRRGGEASPKVTNSTVAHERGAKCVERKLRRLKFEDAPAAKSVDVQITFGA